jgi:mannose-6-phosphate isomerase-like protein (cupin superfamily)
MPFNADIVAQAMRNPFFREVVSTGPHAQVVVMNIPPGGEIGEEVHDKVDQALVFVEGEGTVMLDGRPTRAAANRLVHVTAGTPHNVLNDGTEDLKLYTIYTSPMHAHGAIHRTKAEADAAEGHHASHVLASAAR